MGRGVKCIGRAGAWCLALSSILTAPAFAQSIFDFDEPTTRPAPTTVAPVETPPRRATPSVAVPPDRVYLFPPVPWDDTVLGVVRLTTPPAVPGATTRRATTTTAPTAIAARAVPPVRPANVEALRRRYAPLITEQQTKDYDAIWGADERKAAGKQPDLILLMGTLKAAAKDTTDQPELQRYLYLRAFVAAREARASMGTLNEIARLIRPGLQGDIPSEMLQRAELEGAMADLALATPRRNDGAVPWADHVTWAATAFYNVAVWQARHYYLPEAAATVARAERYAKAGAVEPVLTYCGELRGQVEEWAQTRGQFLEKYHAWQAAPDDPKVNAAYARSMVIVSQGVWPSTVGPLRKSGEPALQALGEAASTRDPVARSGAVGLAMAPLIDAARGKEKAILARTAARQLDEFVKSARPTDPNFTKARLYLSRLKAQAGDTEPVAGAGGGGGGEQAAAGGPLFVETPGRRIVYVLDGTGSMMNKFEALRDSVGKAVDNLKPGQTFGVVLFQDGEATPFRKDLLPATDANKRLAVGFLKRTMPHGSSDPTAALRVAFGQNPDTIYFLSDGDLPRNAGLMAEIHKLNPNRRIKIHTISYVDPTAEDERSLRQIAEESGGVFRAVTADEVR